MRPSIKVSHERFAQFPHVTWANTLCLYQSKLEWNPANGLYGFFERLNLWLAKAALNDMDPLEGPLEPPHHITDYSQVPFVVRANAPVAAGERWLGLAVLEKHANRTELVEWRHSHENWPDNRGMALAITLPKALPMEFPTKGADILSHFDKQGFERNQVLSYLALASLLTPAGEPSYLIVGLPMRRSADGALRVHIAVWSIKSERASSLRLVLGESSDTERLRELRQELGKAIVEVLAATEISWCRVMEDRPEIVVRRDEKTPLAWFRNKRVALLGCGALGSWSGEMIARAGAAKIDLVDNGIVKPGLLARQNFRLEDIGANKATALAARLRTLVAPGTDIQAFDSEVHAFVVGDVVRFAGYDVVVDCTASHITQMLLERDWSGFRRRTPAFVSMIADAKAAQGLCVVLRPNAATGPWDAYVRLKHRVCMKGDRRRIIAGFYDSAGDNDLFQPEPGCSDPTFFGSTADVAAIAATSLNVACEHGLARENEVAVAFSLMSQNRPEAEIVTLDEMLESTVGSYRVRIATRVICEARAWVRQNARLRSASHETGGLLWGMWDDAVGVIWVFDASGPPPDSRHDSAHFICGIEGTVAEHKHRMATSRSTSGFIGYWHTHPDMPSYQSTTDVAGMAQLVSTVGQNQKRSMMLIFGRTEVRPTAGVYVYESHGRTGNDEMVVAGTTQVPLETGVV